MYKIFIACLTFVFLSVTACSSTPLPEGERALIANADADSRRELAQVVAAALGIPSLTLDDDALIASSDLLIDPATVVANGNPLPDASPTSQTEHFRLLLDGPQCVLVHERTGLRWLLMDTECTAE